jgi:hypothetical protein
VKARAAAHPLDVSDVHQCVEFNIFVLTPPLSGCCLLTKGKGQRVVNVKDFGAAGDGAHDDTDAILRAFEAAEAGPDHEVFFPTGTYRFNGACNPKSWFCADEPDGDGDQ